MASFSFHFFVGDIISGVGLGFLAQVTWPWEPITKGNFLTSFYWKLGYNLRLLSL